MVNRELLVAQALLLATFVLARENGTCALSHDRVIGIEVQQQERDQRVVSIDMVIPRQHVQ